MIYLDHNAGSPVRPEVLEAMARASAELPGNPSSVHAAGRRARAALEQARAQVAAFLGAMPEEIVFTSGGTEANNLAVAGLAATAAGRGRHRIVTSPLEHPSVREMVGILAGADAPGNATSTLVDVTSDGAISVGALEAALGEGADCGVVTLALANHELGNLYPVARLAGVAHARGALVHTDAVQAAGKTPLDLGALGVDAASVSAHKLGGPKGIGAVFIRRGLDLPPRLAGGHQERERRPGTENLIGAIGFGVACTVAAAALEEEGRRFESLRRTLVAGLARIPGVVRFGRAAGDESTPALAANDTGAGFLPGTTMVAFPGAPGQLVVIGLDLEGICVSTGAACSSGSLEPSPVLLGLGLGPDAAAEGVRISFGWTTTARDVERLCAVLPEIVARVRGAVSSPAFANAGPEVHA